MMEDEANNVDSEVFEYMGGDVPGDVVRARVHPSVTIIRRYAFVVKEKLEEIELDEGLIEIGNGAFVNAAH